MNFSDKFIYYKTQAVSNNSVSYAWYLIGRENREGVHFHGKATQFLGAFNNVHGFMAGGIECHRKSPDYEDHKPVPGYCMVTMGDCYCDGSSLQAEERLGWINPNGSDDDAIWNVLHEYFESWINNK